MFRVGGIYYLQTPSNMDIFWLVTEKPLDVGALLVDGFVKTSNRDPLIQVFAYTEFRARMMTKYYERHFRCHVSWLKLGDNFMVTEVKGDSVLIVGDTVGWLLATEGYQTFIREVEP